MSIALSFVGEDLPHDTAQHPPNPFTFVEMRLDRVITDAVEERESRRKRECFLEQAQRVKGTCADVRGRLEFDPDRKLEDFRDRCVQYMKSFKNVTNVYFTVGDIVVRNRQLFAKYFKDAFFVKDKTRKTIANLAAFAKQEAIKRAAGGDPADSQSSLATTTARAVKLTTQFFYCQECVVKN